MLIAASQTTCAAWSYILGSVGASAVVLGVVLLGALYLGRGPRTGEERRQDRERKRLEIERFNAALDALRVVLREFEAGIVGEVTERQFDPTPLLSGEWPRNEWVLYHLPDDHRGRITKAHDNAQTLSLEKSSRAATTSPTLSQAEIEKRSDTLSSLRLGIEQLLLSRRELPKPPRARLRERVQAIVRGGRGS